MLGRVLSTRSAELRCDKLVDAISNSPPIDLNARVDRLIDDDNRTELSRGCLCGGVIV